jgi:hypothetical protein
MLGHSIVCQHFMEPEGLIPNSQELSTCSYPEPDQSSPHHPIPPLQDPSFMLGGVPVPTAWRVLGLRMEERPPAMEVSFEYIE